MRVCVVVPPIHDFYSTPRRHAGLGALVVKKIVERHGLRCDYINFPAESPKGKYVPLPPAMHYLQNYLIPNERGQIAYFTSFQRFGPSNTVCVDRILEKNPDLILLSCFAYQYSDDTTALARTLQLNAPKKFICVGGAGVSAHPSKFQNSDAYDFIFTGEAETVLPVFLTELQQETRLRKKQDRSRPDDLREGSVYGIDETAQNSNLCTYTTAKQRILSGTHTRSADIVMPMTYHEEPNGTLRITAALTRGCPRKCPFCSVSICHGDQFRMIPLQRFHDSLMKVPIPRTETTARQGNRNRNTTRITFNFEDDNIQTVPEYFRAARSIIRARFPEVRFTAENGLDYRLLNEKTAQELSEAHFLHFNLSLGSISESTPDSPDRHHFRKIVSTLHQYGTKVIAHFICGAAGDTSEAIISTLLFLTYLPVENAISLFYPVPGIVGFENRTLFNSHPSVRTCGSAAYPWTGSLSTAQLITAFRISRVSNLLKKPGKAPLDEELIKRIFDKKRLFTLYRRNHKTVIDSLPGMDSAMVAAYLEGVLQKGLPSFATPIT